MEFLTLRNVLIAIFVVVVIYCLYNRSEGFVDYAEKRKEHQEKLHKEHLEKLHREYLEKLHKEHSNAQQPLAQSLAQHVAQPVEQPVAQPAVQPTVQPTVQPIVHPDDHPVIQHKEWNRLPGKDFFGFDLYQTTGASIDDCEKSCEEDPFCTHTAWYPNKNNICYHKGVNALGNPPNRFTSGFKNADGKYTRYHRADLAGFDLQGSGSKVPTILDCEENCNNTPNCVNYTYGLNTQNCWIKGPYGSEKGVPESTILSLKP